MLDRCGSRRSSRSPGLPGARGVQPSLGGAPPSVRSPRCIRRRLNPFRQLRGSHQTGPAHSDRPGRHSSKTPVCEPLEGRSKGARKSLVATVQRRPKPVPESTDHKPVPGRFWIDIATSPAGCCPVELPPLRLGSCAPSTDRCEPVRLNRAADAARRPRSAACRLCTPTTWRCDALPGKGRDPRFPRRPSRPPCRAAGRPAAGPQRWWVRTSGRDERRPRRGSSRPAKPSTASSPRPSSSCPRVLVMRNCRSRGVAETLLPQQ